MSESSARPADLDGWARASRRLDDTITTHAARLNQLHRDFTERSKWGYFDGSSLLSAVGTWVAWNEIDAAWVATIARAFRDAGSGSVSDEAIEALLRATGLRGSRGSVTFDDPIALGEPPTSGYALDPVNCATGNFVEVEADMSFGGLARLLRFTRTYNSRSDRVGPFGPGWASWASCRLRAGPDGAHWEGPDGQRAVFPRTAADDGDGDGGGDGRGHRNRRYARLAGVAGRVVPGEDGLAIDWFGGARSEFDADGRPRSVSEGPGTKVSFTHEGDRLVEMAHAGGSGLTFEWSGDRIVRATASDGRRSIYGYDFDGRLIEADGPSGRRRYELDDAGRVVAVIDADGVVEARNHYDAEGRVEAHGSPHGRWTRFRYLPGRVTIVDDDSGGPVNTYVHDDRGRLVSLIDGHGAETTKTYDEWGNPVEVVERSGAVTRHAWTPRSRLARTERPDGSWFELAYDGDDRVTEVTASNGAVTRYRYRAAERSPSEVVDPEGAVTRLDVEDGLVRRITDPDGVEIRFGFDRAGNVVTITDGDGHTAIVERDGAGRVVATESPAGLRTALVYDDRGRLVERHDPGDAIWQFEWTAAGRLAATVDPTGARREIRYGHNGEAEELIDPLGHVVTRRFDALANLVGVVLPDGSKWELVYDGLCRLTGVHDPAGGAWLREYDVNGNLVGSVDPLGGHRTVGVEPTGRIAEVDDGTTSVRFDYDGLGRAAGHHRPDGSSLAAAYDRCGRLIAMTDQLGEVTSYEWTPAGRLASITTPLGATTRFRYDRCGRRTAVVDSRHGRWSYRHDADGRVTQVVAPTGEIDRFRYDGAGRVAVRRSPSRGEISYGYDAAGRVVSVTDASGGERRFVYDPRGALIEAVDPNGGVTRYERDAMGQLAAVIDPLGGRVEHRHDEVGRLVARTDQLGRTTAWEHDAAGRLVRRILPTGECVRWWYDDSGRLTGLGAAGTGTGAVDDPDVRIERDRLGRPVVVEEPGFRHELTWDPAGRLVAKRRNDLELTWRYDADGRRVAVGLPDGSEASLDPAPAGRRARESSADRYDPAGQLIGVRGPEGDWTFTYDAAGRLSTERRPDGATVEYLHDAAHQLVERRGPEGITRYRYDAAGRRVGEEGPYGDHRYAWDPRGNLSRIDAAELRVDALGDLALVDRRELLWDPVGPIPELRWVDGPVDRLPSVDAGRDPWGAGPWGAGPWGAGPWGAGPGGITGEPTIGYRGELALGELVWLRARAYDPSTRCFLSVDPMAGLPGDPFSANPYHYAGNDPIRFVDPLGLRPLSEVELAAHIDAINNGMFERAGDWVVDNWEYIAAGALIVAGAAIMLTGVGGPIGAAMIGGALLSGGLSAGSQRMFTGQVDWGQVGIDMAIGAAGGGLGAGITSTTMVSRVASTTIARGAIAGGTEGLVSGAAYQGVNYARTGQFDPSAVARDTLLGGVTGGAGAHIQERAVLGPLRRIAPDTFESPDTGLVYGPDPNYGNRVNHVLRHTVDDPSRPLHGVFDGDGHVFDVVDDAYTTAQNQAPGVVRYPPQGTRQTTISPFDDGVGYVGGQHGGAAGNPSSRHVQLVVNNGNEVITSYPVAGIPMGGP